MPFSATIWKTLYDVISRAVAQREAENEKVIDARYSQARNAGYRGSRDDFIKNVVNQEKS